MNSFFLACSVVFPLFFYMCIGGAIRKLNLFSYENFKALNKLIFHFYIPLQLILDIYKADVGEAFQPKVFLLVFVVILLGYGLCWIYYTATIKDLPDQATMIQGSFRSNYVLFGTTLGAAICTQPGMALMAALAAMTVPEFNILSVLIFEFKRGGKPKPLQLVKSIFRNPLVDGAIIGLALHLLPFSIPSLILDPLSKLSATANPLALVTLGGMLSFGSMKRHAGLLVQATTARLVIIPLIAVCSAVALGIRGDALVAVLAVFGSPTAVASNPMAQAMGGNGPLAGEIVAVTSAVSVFTLFLFVFVLSYTGMF